MILVKLGLYTCLFYMLLTLLIVVASVAVVYVRGSLSIFFFGRDLFWTAGADLAAFFGALWAISFFAAWCIVYPGLKSMMAGVGH